MFTSIHNHVQLRFRLVPRGPLLVRSGSSSLDPGPAEMEFQRTFHKGRNTVFLAGSGLKGVLRSHCERLLRSARRFACDPTQVGDLANCGRDDQPRPPRDYPFNGQCAACFTFGSLKLAGRFRVDDAFPGEDVWEETNRTERRVQVALERKSQGPSRGALFDLEAVVGGWFDVTLTGENFCLWQLGLVLQTLADLNDGLLQVGGLKSRGFGSVGVEATSAKLRFLDDRPGFLTGLTGAGPEYRLPETDEVEIPEGGRESAAGIFRSVELGPEALGPLREALVAGPLTQFLAWGPA